MDDYTPALLVARIKEQEKEIKTLRSECKRLIHEAAFMQQSRDEEKKWRKIAIDDSNEWKRRARWMWDNRESYFMPATHSKITKWFEEE